MRTLSVCAHPLALAVRTPNLPWGRHLRRKHLFHAKVKVVLVKNSKTHLLKPWLLHPAGEAFFRKSHCCANTNGSDWRGGS